MLHISAAHTVFDKEELFDAMALLYKMGTPLKSRFISNGLNDTYEAETSAGKFILRIYKHSWRTETDIRFELDLLMHLKECGLPVSYPIPRRDGEWITELSAPEGLRYAVLFTFAPGIGKSDVKTSRSYGRAIADLHHAMDRYIPRYKRFELDARHLLDEPLQQLRPFLQHRPHDLKLVDDISGRLRKRLESVANGAYDWGVCHGDLHGWNVFHTVDGGLTHFDFDCCGLGWRSYDLSVFLWDRVHGKEDRFEDECWDAFIGAYLAERPLSEQDIAAIPLFVAVRQLWLIGLHTGRSSVWGAWQDDAYFDGKLKFLSAWADAHQL